MGKTLGAWLDRDVLSATGPDAAKFLQGQMSQDLETQPVGTARWSLLLNPQGRMVAWVLVHRMADDRYLLEVDAGFADAVAARLNRVRIRVACEIAVEPPHQVLAVRGDGAAAVRAAIAEAVPAAVFSEASGSAVADGSGFDVSGVTDVAGAPLGTVAALLAAQGVAIDASAVETWRIDHGVPRMGAELDDSVIPAEVGQWFIDASVSFTKGCYVGQELVARVDSRGASTPFRLRRIEFDPPSAPEVGAELLDDSGKVLGTITSVVAGAGLARVARSVEPPSKLSAAGAVVRVLELGPVVDAG